MGISTPVQTPDTTRCHQGESTTTTEHHTIQRELYINLCSFRWLFCSALFSFLFLYVFCVDLSPRPKLTVALLVLKAAKGDTQLTPTQRHTHHLTIAHTGESSTRMRVAERRRGVRCGAGELYCACAASGFDSIPTDSSESESASTNDMTQ